MKEEIFILSENQKHFLQMILNLHMSNKLNTHYNITIRVILDQGYYTPPHQYILNNVIRNDYLKWKRN
jgi:Na+-transporting NADH:ubiquinone oxidoreductase subunit NqrE